MGLFSKKVRTIRCPICSNEVEQSYGSLSDHWESHLIQIPPGQGDASGQYTWVCSCGPAGFKWAVKSNGAAGLAQHLNERHSIPYS